MDTCVSHCLTCLLSTRTDTFDIPWIQWPTNIENRTKSSAPSHYVCMYVLYTYFIYIYICGQTFPGPSDQLCRRSCDTAQCTHAQTRFVSVSRNDLVACGASDRSLVDRLNNHSSLLSFNSFHSVAVITFASHAKGLQFEPGWKQLWIFFLFFSIRVERFLAMCTASASHWTAHLCVLTLANIF